MQRYKFTDGDVVGPVLCIHMTKHKKIHLVIKSEDFTLQGSRIWSRKHLTSKKGC